MANKKGFSLKDIFEETPGVKTTTIKLEGAPYNGAEIQVKNALPLKEASAFVRSVAETCFSEDTGEYVPELREFALRLYTLIFYAGFKPPKSAEKVYEMVFLTDICTRVTKQIEYGQYIELIDAIDERIADKRAANTATASMQMREFIGRMSSAMDESNRVIEDLKGDELRDAIDRLQAVLPKDAKPDGEGASNVTEMVTYVPSGK